MTLPCKITYLEENCADFSHIYYSSSASDFQFIYTTGTAFNGSFPISERNGLQKSYDHVVISAETQTWSM